MLNKIGWILVIILIFSALCFGEVQNAVKKSIFKTQKEKLSYSIGLDIGKSLKSQSLDIDLKLLTKGINDSLTGTTPLLTDKELTEVFTLMRKDMEERRAKLPEKNKTEGEAFLAANKTKKGVITLASGLQYKELIAGTGAIPTSSDTVTVNYRGTLIDGTEFDSSYKRGEPAKFPVTGVISGWTEALQLMKVGAKWQLFIPANLAYGTNGAGPIGPNAVLIFEVELLSIEPHNQPTTTPEPNSTNK
jgi:FKBP-type peptidyl-prolyl cis-trans isomerase FklB